MPALESEHLRLRFEQESAGGFYFVTDIQDGGNWRPASSVGSRPIDSLIPTEAGVDSVSGSGTGYRWQSQIIPAAGGFRIETVLRADQPILLNPALILWIDALDNLNDRQAHTWRQTIFRAPTVNQGGLPGNDLAAAYLYDHHMHTETICYFPGDSLLWSPHRYYDFTVREVTAYRPTGRYGLGLLPNSPEVLFRLDPGDHQFVWWFTQHYRADIPSPWEAQRVLIDSLAPLLDPAPTAVSGEVPWQIIAENAVQDLAHEACWIKVGGREGLRAYVRGSSLDKRDEAKGFELMTQLDVLWPLLLWHRKTGDLRAEGIIERLHKTLPQFYRPAWSYVANNFPPRSQDSFMDTWYFLENALIKLPWVANLTGDDELREMFLTALAGAQELAHHTGYLFPLFADANGWQPRGSLLNVSVGGLYAAGCVLAHQISGGDKHYLDEAAAALRVMAQLPPHQLTHEPQQLSFAAASAAYLAKVGVDSPAFWKTTAENFIDLSLRMGYWSADPAVPFYDPRGMFQACASLCYPAFKENVETLLAWPELLRDGIGPVNLMATFANLQRRHNYAFFDPYLPVGLQQGPCAFIPYEDLATAEFTHTAQLGKELYGAGEVFWSALLFGQTSDPDILCLNLDIPCLQLQPVPERRCLLYNPTGEHRQGTLPGSEANTYIYSIDPMSVQFVGL